MRLPFCGCLGWMLASLAMTPWSAHADVDGVFQYGFEPGFRILGGDIIAPAFAHEIGPVPELLALGAETSREFLQSLDVFVYRKHPELFETGGTVILEAMAMGLPVIMFPEQCGIAELIEHGRNGFFADSEAEAHALIGRLADEPALRERIGNAARETMVQLMRRQESALFVYMNDTD